MKKTKIICSIGPSSYDYETFKQMVLNGMNVARINFSHATEDEKKTVLGLVKRINDINIDSNINKDDKNA